MAAVNSTARVSKRLILSATAYSRARYCSRAHSAMVESQHAMRLARLHDGEFELLTPPRFKPTGFVPASEPKRQGEKESITEEREDLILMSFSRASGILLHPTSLPGRFGIGDLGAAAYEFVDFLEETGQGLWQILPLGPTGYGDSPYSCLSAFAGNPLLISLEALLAEGLLGQNDLDDAPEFPPDRVDYGWGTDSKARCRKRATASSH